MNDTSCLTDRLTWVVGDIHGCLQELHALERLIERASSTHGRPWRLVSVGDLIDRGPHSKEVVQHFLDGTSSGTHSAVLGNHEMLMLDTILKRRPDLFQEQQIDPPYWLDTIEDTLGLRPGFKRLGSEEEWITYHLLNWSSQGGGETLESYGCDPARPDDWRIPGDHLDYLSSLPLYWKDADCIVTHALAHSQDLYALESGLQLAKDGIYRTVWNRDLPGHRPDRHRIHASGHTPMSRVRRERSRGIIRLDLGAYAGGRLAAWCPQLDQCVSVASKTVWYRGQA